MKNLVMASVAAIVLLTSSASAQVAGNASDTQPTTPTPVPTSSTPTCFGNLCDQDTLSVVVAGGVTRAGMSGAMFDAGEHGIGEAGASSDGFDSVDISMYLNTCEEGCESNGLQATLIGRQQNQSYAYGISEQSAQPVYASTFGTSAVVMDFRAGNNACPGGCPAPSQSGNTDD